MDLIDSFEYQRTWKPICKRSVHCRTTGEFAYIRYDMNGVSGILALPVFDRNSGSRHCTVKCVIMI